MHQETKADGSVERRLYEALVAQEGGEEAAQARLRKRLERDYRRAVRDPDTREILQVLRVGRNDPCPCGSGAKFKKCCMGKAVPA